MRQINKSRNRKILAISSSGGHWTQLMRLSPAFEGFDVAYATTDASLQSQVQDKRFYVVPNATRWNKIRLVSLAFSVFYIVIKERPSVIISTGAAPGFFALMIGRALGARTIWLESIANAEKYSLSTRIVRPFARLLLTQWPHMAREDGPFYRGSVL